MFTSGRCAAGSRGSSTCSKNRQVRLSELNLWVISVIYVQEEAQTGEVGWPADPAHPSPSPSPEFSLRDFTFWLIRIICLDYFDIGVWPIRLWFLPAKSGLLLSLYNWFISEKHNNYIHYICIIKICIICRNTPYVYMRNRSAVNLGFVLFFFLCFLCFVFWVCHH